MLKHSVLSCGDGANPINITLGGVAIVAQTNFLYAVSDSDGPDAGLSLTFTQGILFSGGLADPNVAKIGVANSTEYTLSPGRQAVLVAATAQRSQTGNIQATESDSSFHNIQVRDSSSNMTSTEVRETDHAT